MEYIESSLVEQHEKSGTKDKLYVYNTGSHAGFLTYDGVDVNGKRISDEIRQITKEISTEKDKVTKFSIVGYSLGGLISRYAIGILYSNKYFDTIELINFVTFCTPHVGVLTPGSGLTVTLFNILAPFFLAHTGGQLFLKDTKSISIKENKNHLPLLVWMTDSNSYFFKALKNFKSRSLYANIMNDKRTSWFTSSISDSDPFDSTNTLSGKDFELSYIDNYDPVVIDYSKPVLRAHQKVIQSQDTEGVTAPQGKVQKYFNWIKIFTKVLILSPLWFVWFTTNSLVERIKLNRRVSAFFRDTSNNMIHLYDMINEDISTGIDEDLKEDNLIEDMPFFNKGKKNNSLLDNFEIDINNHVTDHTDNFMENVFDALNDNELDDDLRSNENKLNLTTYQKQIITLLNSLQWKKFPIVIRKTKFAHACAIVRPSDENFEEGKIVVSHFVEENFQFD